MSVPFEILDVEAEVKADVMKIFPKRKDGFVYAGPNKYFLFSKYRQAAAHYINFELRPDDIWSVTFPRTGSTWSQEMIWLINNDLDYEAAMKERLANRFTFFEYSVLMRDEFIKEVLEKNKDDPSKLEDLKKSFTPAYETLPNMKSPRHIKSHFPMSLLPPKLLDTCKVIYVARNPKDVAVSYFHLNKLLKDVGDDIEFSQYWDLFQRDLLHWAPFWSHVEEAWRLKDHKNMLFLFYEDMKKDLPATIRKTANFLGKNITEEQVNKLTEHLHIDNFRKLPSLQQNMDRMKGMKNEGAPGFYRKGARPTSLYRGDYIGQEPRTSMSLPFELNDAPDHVNKELWANFKAEKDKYVQAGPEKYLLCPKYRHEAAGIYNMELRPDDVWVVTFPRSGTTWTQELVWLINNDYDFEAARSRSLSQRFPFIEGSMIIPDYFREEVIKLNQMSEEAAEAFRMEGVPGFKRTSGMVSPRHFKTHLPLSLLPPKLLDTCKVIYVARNPKDVAVSCYHQNSNLKFIGFEDDFEKYWDLFQRDLVLWAPYWNHVEEGWKQRDHPNMLFMFYEDMKKDLSAILRRVAAFLNKSINEEQIEKMIDHLKIDNFRIYPSMNVKKTLQGMLDDTKPGFFRQGKSGTWRNEFSPEVNAKADEWIKSHEEKTDLKFKY
ncbi:uncharacterized protein [Hetaerina americana]|uniref:uncharacterized protein n=1 Tax=Hetaerina americana TaxID=62018 RepID=UPI003A7F2B6B